MGHSRRLALLVSAIAPILTGATCSTNQIVASIAGGTLAGAYTPGHELEQIYYLGSFDPTGQLPAEFYRLTVRGQASLISEMRFGSGWLPAELVDTLSSRVAFDQNRPSEGGLGTIGVHRAKEAERVAIASRRRMIQFGPEGLREAPGNYRLAIVMGSSPEAFFTAMEQSLGTVTSVRREAARNALSQEIFQEFVELTRDREEVQALRSVPVEATLAPTPPAGTP